MTIAFGTASLQDEEAKTFMANVIAHAERGHC